LASDSCPQLTAPELLAGGGLATWRSLAAALGERVFMELDSQQLYTDAVSVELAKELQNGRLLRLLVKLSTVTERPEHDGQLQWSETGAGTQVT
jgi:PAB-dependent poly(A)-specific ribonuclease subunit 3